MTTIMPEGESVRKAIIWVSEKMQEDPQRSLKSIINEAILRFDLSPKDAEFLIKFYQAGKGTANGKGCV
ncbi:hypothetical protein [Thermodesulforhabdus norvegica]|uniref:Uncharacterized protein n=1 Tax=Thermodesulforhabdus norvegica TaxID=39841 RepID=A0A1I4TBV1_9BACT|nr:hypothetical protein [Thermodesulforhabdus norvegica]SFM74204.1 hypothetical protein SAMN05660836_01335 [Thermodesulforhabdus norvegica]